MAGRKHVRFVLIVVATALLLAATCALLVNIGESNTASVYPSSAPPSTAPPGSSATLAESPESPNDDQTAHDLDVETVLGESQAPTHATISGVVFDTRGRTLAGMTIGAEKMNVPEGHGFRVDETNENGAFRLVELTAGTYHLKFMSVPKSQDPAGPFTVAAGDALEGVRLVYEGDDMHVVSGRVTNTAGEPVQHAYLYANLERGNGFSHAATDESGNYTLKRLAPGTHRIEASHAEYTRQERSGVPADASNINFVLTGRGSIEGHVVDASNGQPITKFKIGAMPSSHGFDVRNLRANLPFVNDPQGTFQVDADAMDNYLVVIAEGYAPSVQVVPGVREGATVSGIVVQLEPGATIEGQVVNASGQPVSDAKIYTGNVVSKDPTGYHKMVATSDDTGHFKTKPLDDPEVSSITAVHEDYASTSLPVTLNPGETTHVTIELRQGGTVKGKVTVAGQPASAEVHVTRRADGQGLAITNTDRSGLYLIERVSEGEVRVMAIMREEGSNQNAHQEAVVAENEVTVVDFDFAGGNAAIEGYATVDGQPIARAHVNASVTSTSGVRESFNCDVDEKGFYELSGMSAGYATLHLTWQDADGNQQARSAQVDLFGGQVTQHDFEITVGTAIAGSVCWEDDSQVGVALLRGEKKVDAVDNDFWSDNEENFAAFSMVRPDGTFHVSGLEPGDYTVVAFTMTEETSSDLSASRVASQFIRISGEGEVPVSLTLP